MFSKQPATCLKDIEDTWPRDGVLRVEIVYNASSNYSLQDSYKKEYGAVDFMNLFHKHKKSDQLENVPQKTEQMEATQSLTEVDTSPLLSYENCQLSHLQR